MPSLLRRAMVYLGLVDDEYDDVYESPYETQHPLGRVADQGMVPSVRYAHEAENQMSVIRTLPREETTGIGEVTARPAVVSISPKVSARVHVVVASDFNEAALNIGTRFQESQPVIVNLQEVDRELRRRLIDFCSGMCFGLKGQMGRVAQGVFLLRPANVEVSEEERRRLQERGYRT